MKRLLKTFPDKSSSENSDCKKSLKEIKAEIVQEVEEIKEEITFKNQLETDDGFKVLANLFKYLREIKNLRLLSLCRQFQNITINQNKVCIIADEEILNEIYRDNDHSKCLKEFFEKLGLSLKIDKKSEQVSAIDKLKDWLGDRLIIK